jgi:hypothetical protein
MTQTLMSRDKAEAKKKGYMALSAWAGAGALTFFAHWPIPGLVAAGAAAYLTYKWFMFRARRGMRF